MPDTRTCPTWARHMLAPEHGTEPSRGRSKTIADWHDLVRTRPRNAPTRTFTGTVQAGSVQTFEMLRNDLVGDRFFEVERYPTISLVSSSVEEPDGALIVEGDLTLKGVVTKRVRGEDAIAGPSTVAHYDDTVHDHLGIDLDLTIDRRDFGVDFNNELLAGGLNLGWDVQIELALELSAPVEDGS